MNGGLQGPKRILLNKMDPMQMGTIIITTATKTMVIQMATQTMGTQITTIQTIMETETILVMETKAVEAMECGKDTNGVTTRKK